MNNPTYKPKHSDPEENRQENRASGIWRKVQEHAQWSHIAQSMMYTHNLGHRWSGREIAAYKSFHDAIKRRREEQAARENTK